MNPYVEVEIFGADFDCQRVRTARTIRTFPSNDVLFKKYHLIQNAFKRVFLFKRTTV